MFTRPTTTLATTASLFVVWQGNPEAYGWSGWTGRDNSGNPYVNGLTATINGIKTNTSDIPLYFVRSGLITGKFLQFIGTESTYWAATVANSANVYRLLINRTSILPTITFNQTGGFSIRCVAR